jgi:tetratricopeptide (TPR) repeat protein
MSFADELSAAWSDHGTDADGVAVRLTSLLDQAYDAPQLVQLAGLVAHVNGEHLGRWIEGMRFLDRIAGSPMLEGRDAEQRTVQRTKAVLVWGGGDEEAARDLVIQNADTAFPLESSTIRLLAGVSAALAGQGRIDEATQAFEGALSLADLGLRQGDPAARSLAVTGNNLACELEERAERTDAETELMKQAARAARNWWEVAGTWTNVMYAEARLAFTHLEAGEPVVALVYAQQAVAMVENNGGNAETWLTPLLALARAHLAGRNLVAAAEATADLRAKLEQAPEQVRSWYVAGLAELEEALDAG